jgi:hypothetical protein
VDAISSLVAGTQRAQATLDAAAQQIAQADLPTSAAPADVMNPQPSTNVDVADQLTTMMVAADMHQITTAALRSALAMYATSVDMLSTPDPS